jgi:N-acetylated-alpha-linked acidic dipeptidase
MQTDPDLYEPTTGDGVPQRKRLNDALSKWKIAAIVGAVVAVAVVLALVIVISHKKDEDAPPLAGPSPNGEINGMEGVTDDAAAAKVRVQFAALAQNDTIAAFMKEYSRYPHLASSARNIELAEITAQKWKQFGFDEVRVDYVPVLLEQLNSRYIHVHDAAGAVRYHCVLDEPNIVNESDYAKALNTSNGYSGNGTVTAPIIWANYGTEEDFKTIEKLVDIRGKIVVVRYGQIFRGNKVQQATLRGAIGVIIVHDAIDLGYLRGPVFPDGPWATNLTVQRGSIYNGEGDPRTPTWPSEVGGPALSGNQFFNDSLMVGNPLTTVPVQPMGYGDANEVLKGLGGVRLPPDWNVTGFLSVLGGGIGPSSYNVTLSVLRELVTANIANVHGVIRGAVEPDRVVVIGSHRDAWTYGAVDPISGASTVLEISRVLGQLHLAGWTPRRSIQLTSWGGEEQALLGSMEYVEQQVELLRQRAIAYINVDTAVTGTEAFSVDGSPSFGPLVEEVTRLYTVGAGGSTLKSIWTGGVTPPGSGSDHTGFIQLAGVPVLIPEIDSNDSSYEAVYHSNYDCYYWVVNFGDPQFQAHLALVKFIGDVALRLADLNLIPLSPQAYASKVSDWVDEYALMPSNDFANFTFINNQARSFVSTATSFTASRDALVTSLQANFPDANKLRSAGITPFKLRALNDAVVGLERVFLAGEAETDSGFYKHVLFTPSAIDSYGSSVMPLIADALASGDATRSNFAMGRVAQFIGRAARFVNTTTWWI